MAHLSKSSPDPVGADGTTAPALGRQAARGASVTLIGQIIRIVIQVGSVAVLARLLDPVDYGLVAIVLAVVGFGEILRDSGLSTAAVQARGLDVAQRDQLLWLNTAIGAVLTVLGICAAPLVAMAFDQPALTPITQALSFTFLINGMTAQYRASLNRDLRFGALVATDLIAQILGVVIATILALAGTEYWALVAQQLGQALLTLLVLMIFARWLPGRPRRGVDIKSMTRFGQGLMATQLVGYLNSNVDTYTIGLTLGPGPLGVYNRGFQLLMRPLNQLRAPTTTVALPVLSKLAHDPERAGQYIVRGQLALGYTLVAGLAFGAGAAAPLIAILLGSEWSQVAPIFAFLAIAGIFQTLSYVGNWVYLARALTSHLFGYSLISLAIKIVCVLVGSRWGILGVAGGYAVAPALSWPISLWWLSRVTPLPLRALWLGAMRISGCAVVGGAGCYGAVAATSQLSAIWQLVAGLVSLVLSYGLLALIVPRIRRDFREVAAIGRKALHR